MQHGETILARAAALRSQGQRSEAITLLEGLHAGPQRSSQSCLLLGQLYAETNQLKQAIESLSQGVLLDPEASQLWKELGVCFQRSRQVQLAGDALRHAYSLAPEDPDVSHQLGMYYLSQHELDRAEECFQRSAESTELLSYQLAVSAVWELRGDYQRAYELLRPHPQLIRRSCLYSLIWAKVCRQLERAEEALPVLEDCLGRSPLPKDRRHLLHERGDVLEQLGRPREAFACWEEANQIRLEDWSSARWEAQLQQERAFYVRSRWSRLAVPSSSLRQRELLLIVGMPRSGTSLLEQILSRHPEVQAGGERPQLLLIEQLLERKHGVPHHQVLEGLGPEELDGLLSFYLQGQDLKAGCRVLTDKMPRNFKALGLARLLFPRLRVVHCVRNPLDTLLSCFKQKFDHTLSYTTDLRWLADYYISYRRMMEHWQELEAFPMLEHRYHELLDDPEGAVRRLLQFCGLPWDERCLHFHHSTRHVSTASYAQVREPLNRRSQGRWRPFREELREIRELLESEGLLEGFPEVS